MKILITGVGGMVGSHLADYLSKEHQVVGTYYKPTINLSEITGKVELIECDVRYYKWLYSCMDIHRPEKIFHLAAQSYPTVSLVRPNETIDTNINGTINLFDAVKQIKITDKNYNPKIIVACSSAEYGASLVPENIPIIEEAILQPLHCYGVSKVAQDLITYQYFVNDNIYGIRARIFNTTGPRKVNDVCSDFTLRVVQIEKGEREFLPVGNLETRRAITDVRDLITALWLLSDKGIAGEVYNISGQFVYKISEIIDIIRQNAKVPFEIKTDINLLRPTDEPVIYGDSSKLKEITGWTQSYQLKDTIRDMLDYWRSHIS
jgi:nucleoside-diphosphate-sugar epimerase